MSTETTKETRSSSKKEEEELVPIWHMPPGATTTTTAVEIEGEGCSNMKQLLNPDEIWNIIQGTQVFETCPYTRSLEYEMNSDDKDNNHNPSLSFVTVAMISDTHSKHHMFGGYEVPLKWFEEGDRMKNTSNTTNEQKDNETTSNRQLSSDISALTYINSAVDQKQYMQSKVLNEIRHVMNKCVSVCDDDNSANAREDANDRNNPFQYLFRPLPLHRQGGLVHTSEAMAIMPVIQLSGNRKSVVAPPEWIGNHQEVFTPNDVEEEGQQEAGSKNDETMKYSNFNNDEYHYPIIPYTDILIHCGDMTMKGSESEFERFVEFMAQLPHRHKIVIAGNHDLALDEEYLTHHQQSKRGGRWKHLKSCGNPHTFYKRIKQRMKDAGILYLHDELITVDIPVKSKNNDATTTFKSLTIFGSPTQPKYHDWAFQIERGLPSKEYWERVFRPLSKKMSHVDILVTHGPPVGRADRVFINKVEFYRQLAAATRTKQQEEESSDPPAALDLAQMPFTRVGCPHLLWEVQHTVKPKVHCFGHVHEDAHLTQDSYDGTTLFVNACVAGHYNELRQTSHVKTVCLAL